MMKKKEHALHPQYKPTGKAPMISCQYVEKLTIETLKLQEKNTSTTFGPNRGIDFLAEYLCKISSTGEIFINKDFRPLVLRLM